MSKMLPGELPPSIKGLPNVLLPYQAHLLATTSDQQVVFCEKSRRIGITWGVAADATLVAASSRKAGGMNVFYMGYNLEMAREFINVCADWAKIFNHAVSDIEDCVFDYVDEHGETREIKAFRITFASGFSIIALPSSPRSLRGMQGYVILDEAAFHENLEEVLKAAYALLMWGGKVLVISTHDGADNVFNQQVQAIKENRKGFTKHKLVTITFSDAIRDGLYERICLTKGQEYTKEGEKAFIEDIYEFYGEGAEEELDVIPRRSGGAYFPAVLVEPCMEDVPVINLELPDEFFSKPEYEKERFIQDWCEAHLKPVLNGLDKTLTHSFGFDCGRSGDLSTFAPMAIEKSMRRRCPFMVEMRNVPYSQQQQVLFYACDRLPGLYSAFADATGIGAMLAEKLQERYGQNVVNAVKINVAWYEAALPPYRGAMQDKSVSIPKHGNILQDHRTAQMVGGVPQIPRKKGDDGKQRHGDSLIALAGAYWATLQDWSEYDYTPVFSRSPAGGSKNHEDDDGDDDYGISRNFGNNKGAY